MSYQQFDTLVLGAGAAGLTLALQLAETQRVVVVSKSASKSSSTYWAQGGIAAVLDEDDTVEEHVADTLVAGAGLCDRDAVQFIVENGKEAIHWLIDQGVQFSKEKDGETYHLTKEGGHGNRRIIHAADATGMEVAKTLTQLTEEHPNITLLEDYIAVDLVVNKQSQPRKCSGAYLLNLKTNEVELFSAKATVLATGGASKVYLYTSNPDGNSGDGIAMAWRAGCRVANMEFNQFHPTCLYHPNAKSFLITEAVRGEGGILRLPDGSEFMHRYDERRELAPRDIVARAIDNEMKRLGADCLFLDISHKDDDFIISHFPNAYKRCLKLGIDITKEPIPVVPAAHYTCGGVMVDHNGRTDIEQLYAIGETSYTGLHGANRMASNSLLECIVYGRSTAKHILENIQHWQAPKGGKPWDASKVTSSDEEIVISHNWDELRRFMWDYVGIVRTNKRLQRAEHRITLLKEEIAEYYRNHKVGRDLIELRNLVVVADLMIQSAMTRKESRGLHYTRDYDYTLPAAQNTVLTPKI